MFKRLVKDLELEGELAIELDADCEYWTGETTKRKTSYTIYSTTEAVLWCGKR